MSPHIKTLHRDDDLDARSRQIQARLLDAISETLDELEQPHARRAAIGRAVGERCAALLCRQAVCRRAGRCRRQPCAVPDAGARRRDSASWFGIL